MTRRRRLSDPVRLGDALTHGPDLIRHRWTGILKAMVLHETTFYLEMRSRDELRPGRNPDNPPALKRISPPQPRLNAELYSTIGRDWLWTDRLAWTHDDWLRCVSRCGLETWLATEADCAVGYFELLNEPGEAVKLEYFGVHPDFTGRGLGGWLLTRAVELAWDRSPGPARVWLHTSSHDSPAALKNYLARGFRLFRQVTASKEYPDDAVERWRQRSEGAQ